MSVWINLETQTEYSDVSTVFTAFLGVWHDWLTHPHTSPVTTVKNINYSFSEKYTDLLMDFMKILQQW